MIKHIGKHGDKRVVVLYPKVPSEDHMCLLVYSDLLPRLIHDDLMKTLESPIGQQAENLADALFRTVLADGRNPLEVLHKQGYIKKVQTSQVILTPTPATKIRLDELNSILAEMAKGEDAVKRLADIDNNSGMRKKAPVSSKTTAGDVGEPSSSTKSSLPTVPTLQAGPNEALTDEVIATQQIAQATRMRAEAKSLLSEADRLEGEAAALAPSTVKRKVGRPKSVKNATAKKAETAQV